MNVTQYSKYALSIFFIFVLYIAYLLLKPFLLTILTAVILVYVFSPVYNFVNRKLITNKYICSLVVLTMVFVLLSIPVVFILHSLSQQGYEQYTVLKETFSDPTLLECTNGNTEFCTTYMSFLNEEERSILQDFLKNSVVNIAQKIISSTFSLLSCIQLRQQKSNRKQIYLLVSRSDNGLCPPQHSCCLYPALALPTRL